MRKAELAAIRNDLSVLVLETDEAIAAVVEYTALEMQQKYARDGATRRYACVPGSRLMIFEPDLSPADEDQHLSGYNLRPLGASVMVQKPFTGQKREFLRPDSVINPEDDVQVAFHLGKSVSLNQPNETLRLAVDRNGAVLFGAGAYQEVRDHPHEQAGYRNPRGLMDAYARLFLQKVVDVRELWCESAGKLCGIDNDTTNLRLLAQEWAKLTANGYCVDARPNASGILARRPTVVLR